MVKRKGFRYARFTHYTRKRLLEYLLAKTLCYRGTQLTLLFAPRLVLLVLTTINISPLFCGEVRYQRLASSPEEAQKPSSELLTIFDQRTRLPRVVQGIIVAYLPRDEDITELTRLSGYLGSIGDIELISERTNRTEKIIVQGYYATGEYIVGNIKNDVRFQQRSIDPSALRRLTGAKLGDYRENIVSSSRASRHSIVGTSDGTIIIWPSSLTLMNAQLCLLTHKFSCGSRNIRVSISPSGKYFCLASGRSISVFSLANLKSPDCLATFGPFEKHITALSCTDTQGVLDFSFVLERRKIYKGALYLYLASARAITEPKQQHHTLEPVPPVLQSMGFRDAMHDWRAGGCQPGCFYRPCCDNGVACLDHASRKNIPGTALSCCATTILCPIGSLDLFCQCLCEVGSACNGLLSGR